jgi:hypothetical protein
MSDQIMTKEHGLVSIVGSYKHARNGVAHAVIHNGQNYGDLPYRTLCETYRHLYFEKLYICSFPSRDVTCKRCLRMMGEQGPRATEMNIPDEPKQKKFFLVTFDDDSMETYSSLTRLQEKIKQYKEEITEILIIDSYRTVSMRTVLVDEKGEEITEQDL